MDYNWNEFTAQPGEIVEVDGYDGYFKVDCQRVEVERDETEVFEDVYYELTNIHTGEYLSACDEDLTLVADASQADDFIANMASEKRRTIDPGSAMIYLNGYWIPVVGSDLNEQIDMGAINMAGNNERKLTAREQSAKVAKEKKEARKKREKFIDSMLDRRYNAKVLSETFPEDKEKYERRIAKVDAVLAKVSDSE
jgi:hypothetical protein